MSCRILKITRACAEVRKQVCHGFIIQFHFSLETGFKFSQKHGPTYIDSEPIYYSNESQSQTIQVTVVPIYNALKRIFLHFQG